MTNEQIETEIKHLATKEELAKLGERIQTQLGDFKADLIKTVWLSQLSMAGILVALVGIMNGATFFFINQALTQAIANMKH
jgi:hypothetical protein